MRDPRSAVAAQRAVRAQPRAEVARPMPWVSHPPILSRVLKGRQSLTPTHTAHRIQFRIGRKSPYTRANPRAGRPILAFPIASCILGKSHRNAYVVAVDSGHARVGIWLNSGPGQQLLMEGREIILLVLLVFFVAFLLFRQAQRERCLPRELQLPGHGIDVTNLSHRIQESQDGVQSRPQAPPHDAERRRVSLASARRNVVRLAYFQQRATDDSEHVNPAA